MASKTVSPVSTDLMMDIADGVKQEDNKITLRDDGAEHNIQIKLNG